MMDDALVLVEAPPFATGTGHVPSVIRPQPGDLPHAAQPSAHGSSPIGGKAFVFAFVLALVLATALAWRAHGLPAAAFAICCGMLPAFIAYRRVARRHRWPRRNTWSTIALEDEQVRLARDEQQVVVRYGTVQLIDAEAFPGSSVAGPPFPFVEALDSSDTKRSAYVTLGLRIHTESGERFDIPLSMRDTVSCFRTLMSRCPRAGSIALDGTEEHPQIPEAKAGALRTMAQLRRSCGRPRRSETALLPSDDPSPMASLSRGVDPGGSSWLPAGISQDKPGGSARSLSHLQRRR